MNSLQKKAVFSGAHRVGDLNMKKMKLFPKTFLYTFFMLLFITTSMHLMIYFFYPKVYLSRMQDQLEKKMETLQQEIKRNTAAEAGQIFS